MLTLSRSPGASLVISSADETCVVTLLKLAADDGSATLLATYRSAALRPGELRVRTLAPAVGQSVQVGPTISIGLLNIASGIARLDVTCPTTLSVHRLEVCEALMRDTVYGHDDDEGMAGSRVPRPDGPTPPTLKRALDPPPPDDDTLGEPNG